MPRGSARRLIPSLLIAAIFLVASPSQAQNLGPTVNVSNTKFNAATFSTSMAVSGSNVYVVWIDEKGTGQPLFSRSTNSGSSFSTAIQIFSGFSTISPHVAATGTSVYVVRSARPSPKSPSQIYFKRSTDNGATFASQIQVSNTSVDGAFFEAMAISGSNVHIVWRQWVGNWALFFARSINSGATFGTPVNLSNSIGDVEDADVAADGTGVHAAWTERTAGNAEIIYRTSGDQGAMFGDRVNISNTTTSSVFPALAVSGSSVYVSYWDDPGIMFSCSLGGGGFSVPISLSGPGVGGPPQIVATGTDVHVIWHANPNSNYDVLYTRSNDACATFSLPSNISNSAPDSFGVLSASGPDVYVTWGEGSPGEISMAHSGNHGAIFAGAVNVSANSGHSDYRGLFSTATPGEIHVIWLDRTPGNAEVFYRRGTIP